MAAPLLNQDPDNDQNKSGFNRKKVIFAVMLIILTLLVFRMVTDIVNLPGSVSPGKNLKTAVNASIKTHEIPVGFRVSGRIDQMFFAERAEVKKGDVLATLDKVPFEEALASAKAQLQVSEAEYNKSAHLPTQNFNAIEAARANVETAQHTYDVARDELEKRRALITAQTFTIDNVYNDDVQNEHDAELSLERARRELAQQEDIGGNSINRDLDKAIVQADQTNVAIAETNLADTRLLAPADGVIISRIGQVGATASSDATIYILSSESVVTPNP